MLATCARLNGVGGFRLSYARRRGPGALAEIFSLFLCHLEEHTHIAIYIHSHAHTRIYRKLTRVHMHIHIDTVDYQREKSCI